MHNLTLSSRVELGPTDIIEPGEYVLDDVSAAHLIVLAGGGSMSPLAEAHQILAQRVEMWNPDPAKNPEIIHTTLSNRILFM